MRVFVDDQIVADRSHGGAARYVVELTRFLIREAADVEVLRSWRWTKNAYAQAAGLGTAPPWWAATRGSTVRRANRPYLRRARADIIHHTYYDAGYLTRGNGAARVVSVYDMIPELYPQLFPHGNPHGAKRRFVQEADLVLCISESTRRDLVHLWGDPPGQVAVTPLGVDDVFRPGAPPLGGAPEIYVAYVGNRGGYKDFTTLLHALTLLRAEFPDVHLLAVGGGPLSRAERELVDRLRLRDRVVWRAVAEPDLPSVYANARCFVFPSRYEGFGLPTLEAMASGCPVVLADSPTHREVGGTSAMFFRPGEPEDLAVVLRTLLGDDHERSERIGTGRRHAAGFSWYETGRRTLAAYRALLGDVTT